MKALNYLGPFQVKVQEVEKPKLEHPDDVIVKVTTVRMRFSIFLICFSSFMYMYTDRAALGCYLRLGFAVSSALFEL